MTSQRRFKWNYLAFWWALATMTAGISRADTVATLLGNFTINQYCGLNLAGDGVTVHYAVIFGQLPALRELHLADADGDGVTSQAERDAYVGTLAPGLAKGLELRVDGVAVPLRATRWTSSLPNEQGGFSLRLDVDFVGGWPATAGSRHSLEFTNQNYPGRIGWHEIVVQPTTGLAVFDTNAFSTSLTGGLTEALQVLPEAGPLDERTVHLGFGSTAPAQARLLTARPGSGASSGAVSGARSGTVSGDRVASVGSAAPGAVSTGLDAGTPRATEAPRAASAAGGFSESAWITRHTRQLVEAISSPRLAPHVVLLALLGALLLGGVHALSPGHGKTIVGAYLIGSRGTPRHALFLGLTVTVTHTLGVFVLGFATLYASRFIVPERLFPILSLISAVLVLAMGVILLIQRGKAARQALTRGLAGSGEIAAPRDVSGARDSAARSTATRPLQFQAVAPAPRAVHNFIYAQTLHADPTLHSHGGGPMHSHLPPGAAGEKVTWRSLLTLGISGGLVPCPSAMVLLLAAVALNKTAYGMLLVVAFSVGLAITLTLVGLAFLYARNRFHRPERGARWPHLLPVMSAGAITVVGAALCVGAMRSFG